MRAVAAPLIALFLLAAVPFAPRPVQAGHGGAYVSHTVQSGDSLWRLARHYGATVNGIKQASNHWSDRILVGQRLCIPVPPRQAAAPAGTPHRLTGQERELLARLIDAEARGEPFEGMVAVGVVVLNRVRDPRFPNTLAGVVYQRHAFESVSNGLVWRRAPSGTAWQAVDAVLSGWNPVPAAVFFWNPYKPVIPWIWTRPIVRQIGNHVFAV